MNKFLNSFIVIVLLLFSCEKEKNVENDTNLNPDLNTNLTEQVKSQNGVLIFKDSKSLNETMKKISQMTREEVKTWENKLNFTSQNTIFGDIVDVELKLDEPYEKMTKEERKSAPLPVEHSKIYYDNLKSGLIKIIYDDEDPEYESYDFSVCLPSLTPIINKDGIFMIGDTIFQLTSTSIKKWGNGDINNLQVLKTTEESNGNIKIEKIMNHLKTNVGPILRSTDWIKKGEKRRMKLEEYFRSWQYIASGTVYRYQHYIHVRSEKKSLGKWKLNWTTMYLRGRMEAKLVYYYDGLYPFSVNYYPAFPSNYPYPYIAYINNFYSSISIFDGSVSPYPATWNVHYQKTYGVNEILEGIYLYSAKWEAVCHDDAYAQISY